MDWVRSHHLTADSHQAANTHGGQLTDPIYLFNTGKRIRFGISFPLTFTSERCIIPALCTTT